jgi:DNA mismatch endonuclease (patch repair protein)
MSDVHDRNTRSYNMRQIKSKNTKPEIKVRRFLFEKGFRYRLHDKNLPGKPDIVLPKYRCIVFVNGCFWHGHDSCKYFVLPKTRDIFWLNKINKNKTRDLHNINELNAIGWKTIIIWECQLRNSKEKDTLQKLVIDIKSE